MLTNHQVCICKVLTVWYGIEFAFGWLDQIRFYSPENHLSRRLSKMVFRSSHQQLVNWNWAAEEKPQKINFFRTNQDRRFKFPLCCTEINHFDRTFQVLVFGPSDAPLTSKRARKIRPFSIRQQSRAPDWFPICPLALSRSNFKPVAFPANARRICQSVLSGLKSHFTLAWFVVPGQSSFEYLASTSSLPLHASHRLPPRR